LAAAVLELIGEDIQAIGQVAAAGERRLWEGEKAPSGHKNWFRKSNAGFVLIT
jgi:hypothetical protein